MATPNVQMTVTVPEALLARIDEMLEQVRASNPFVQTSRSQLVSHLLAEHIALLDEPEKEPAPAPRERRRPA